MGGDVCTLITFPAIGTDERHHLYEALADYSPWSIQVCAHMHEYEHTRECGAYGSRDVLLLLDMRLRSLASHRNPPNQLQLKP